MATSYANLGGSGDRRGVVGVFLSPQTLIGGAAHPELLDGDFDNELYFASATVSSAYWLFDFGSPVVIDEAKFYQDIADSNGVWKWQGSNDNSSFTDIGSSFTLGTSATHTITELNGNTTAYRYYRLQGVSGSLSGASWVRQWEFKIDGMVDPTSGTSYANTGGTGDRRSIITMSNSGIIAGTPPYNGFINGNTADNVDYFTGGALSGSVYVRWDFGSGNAQIIKQAKFYHSNQDTHGVWKWQGSNDASSWTDIGHQFVLGGYTGQIITALSCNATAYRYYQIVGVSGSTSGSPWVHEFEFMLAAGGGAPANTSNFFQFF